MIRVSISISSVLAKTFEASISSLFESYFRSEDNQFGFKKATGCTDAIFCANKLICSFTGAGDTAHIAALDISKAFDKVNHYALFLKLMDRNIPQFLLDLLVNWLARATSCVKWHGAYSAPYSLRTGVRQDSVLAPALFAIYINDVARVCSHSSYGFAILYADDILLLSRSRL